MSMKKFKNKTALITGRASWTIIKAMKKNRNMVTLPGYIYPVTRLGQAIMPIRMFDWFAGKVLGIYKTMDEFTGRR
jgi:hypothetical protein